MNPFQPSLNCYGGDPLIVLVVAFAGVLAAIGVLGLAAILLFVVSHKRFPLKRLASATAGLFVCMGAATLLRISSLFTGRPSVVWMASVVMLITGAYASILCLYAWLEMPKIRLILHSLANYQQEKVDSEYLSAKVSEETRDDTSKQLSLLAKMSEASGQMIANKGLSR